MRACQQQLHHLWHSHRTGVRTMCTMPHTVYKQEGSMASRASSRNEASRLTPASQAPTTPLLPLPSRVSSVNKAQSIEPDTTSKASAPPPLPVPAPTLPACTLCPSTSPLPPCLAHTFCPIHWLNLVPMVPLSYESHRIWKLHTASLLVGMVFMRRRSST